MYRIEKMISYRMASGTIAHDRELLTTADDLETAATIAASCQVVVGQPETVDVIDVTVHVVPPQPN